MILINLISEDFNCRIHLLYLPPSINMLRIIHIFVAIDADLLG